MGGLGKTTLAQLVYNDKEVVTLFDLRMWVYVSEDFDVRRLLKQILESASKKKPEQSSIDLLHTSLRDELSGKRYLLVLDDVWNDVRDEFFEKWDRLKTWLECGSMGSKVLVTTRDVHVADTVGTLPTHQLGKLSTEDSWKLFENLVNPEKNLLRNLLSIGKEMVGKCGGLPLAVKTLGGLMSSKKTESEWEYVKNSEFWKPQDSNGRVLSILRLSYDHLTSSLKQCFAYCAVIPKGDVIDKDLLIKQWIAQGFIHSNRENELLEEKGEEVFKELLRRTLPNSEFIIAKESGARIEELKGLNLLWGNIHIGGLDNIGSVGCAGEADLKAKKHLNSLKLSWSSDQTVAAEGNAKEVIEITRETGVDCWSLIKSYRDIGNSLMVKFGLCHFKFNKALQV
ncbi:hypothetical protein AAC387_Pa11g0305 [Persea americana]